MIRKFELKDINQIYQCAKSFEKESNVFKSIGGIDEKTFKENLEKYFNHNLLKCWVVEKENKIVSGLACVEILDFLSNVKCLIEMFWFCLKEYRGNLENIKMFKIMEDYAKNNDIGYIQMIHLCDSMPEKMEKFYKKKGYKMLQKCYNKELI